MSDSSNPGWIKTIKKISLCENIFHGLAFIFSGISEFLSQKVVETFRQTA